MTTMNPEIKAEWVKRLRDGRVQGRSVLENVDEDGNVTAQCCLGVLCEIAAEQGVVERTVNDHNQAVYGNQELVLPGAVIDWSGISDGLDNPSISGRYIDTHYVGSLAEANDAGADFNAIADIIEKEFS